ncbi:F510_1955 family glycosylhydrolase [Nocardioides daphniae]|nr:hypothetical protein [Nocardioides daphniae]
MNRSRLATATLALTTTILAAGCSSETPTQVPSPDATEVGHIHGLGIDPADDTLYVATHFGLFHVTDDEEPTRVADRYQDTMAFTVVGPGHFLGSGHPDLREDLPPHLGLIESIDAGQTWRPLALQGKADFHILEPAGDVLYAYDATSGRLLRTKDRATFEEVLTAPLLSVAITETQDQLIATTDQAQLITINPETGETRKLGGPATTYLDTAPDGTLAAIAPDGAIHISSDDGQDWKEVGSIGGQPAAFTISDQGWYAATDTTVLRSTDSGATWARVL